MEPFIHCKPLNCRKLAAAMDVAYGFVLDAKRAGCPFPGNKITISAFMGWITANPDYREKARELRAVAPLTGRL